jgi:hypothetical protein
LVGNKDCGGGNGNDGMRRHAAKLKEKRRHLLSSTGS